MAKNRLLNNNVSLTDPFYEFGGQMINSPIIQPATPSQSVDPFKEFGGTQTRVPAKNFYSNYMESPMFNQRLGNVSITPDPNAVQDLLNTHITQQKGENGGGSMQWTKDASSLINNHPDIRNQLGANGININPKSANINIDRNDIPLIKKAYGYSATPEQVLTHELGHGVRDISGTADAILINSLIKKGTENLNSSMGSTSEHDNNPNEIYADMNELRYMMYKKGIYDTSKRAMTMDDFNKAKNDPDIKKSMMFQRMMQRISPKNFILMNNTVAANRSPQSNTDYLA